MEVWREEQLAAAIDSGQPFCFYLFTPLCGTCHVASKILDVTEKLMPQFMMGKADLNYMPEIAETYQIESVPCLLLFTNGELQKKIYAFKSVPYIYEILKKLA
ncbi:thioredoxin-like negative regulator of GroEL [Peribacillus deserti]|uniref:Thioredoxin-like negative regulator of GroEL n=1 Tax=Peribacillus deserti TaxID=673318 RepID=A0ABS2QPQ2_9BACI|nr:thioredoxin family protein [Peribacillus deserti]MBM7694448.1 thioredoxin-like negative regulator of GroEL [Peribacillus deserti]